MIKEKLTLAASLNASISPEIMDIISDIGEAGLDLICEDEILKGIPFVSTVVSLYKIGSAIRDKHNLNKMFAFIQQMNQGITDEKQREKYAEDFRENVEKRSAEIEYLILILDRYIGCDKARWLSKLFLVYLDSKIDWLTLCKYSEVIDRFLPGDYDVLSSTDTYKTERDLNTDAIQRLIAQGLVIEGYRSNMKLEEGGVLNIDPPDLMEKSERNYKRTEFGDLLAGILGEA